MFVYKACIQSLKGDISYQSKESFKTYAEAWDFLRDKIPNGFEGFVINLPNVSVETEFPCVDLEEICIAQEQFDNQSH